MAWENVRNNKEALIEEIAQEVETACRLRKSSPPARLRQRIATHVNLTGITTTDLHYVLKRKDEVRNFVGYVVSVFSTRRAADS